MVPGAVDSGDSGAVWLQFGLQPVMSHAPVRLTPWQPPQPAAMSSSSSFTTATTTATRTCCWPVCEPCWLHREPFAAREHDAPYALRQALVDLAAIAELVADDLPAPTV